MPAQNGGASVGVGARVVRGPDWSQDFGDQDGGEGHLGSLVEICGQSEDDMYPRYCVVVQWDNGERNVYRAGYENAYDLRLFDNAGTGVKHDRTCSGCDCNTILGFMWKCQQCPSVCLCSDCYGQDKHDINHAFTRFDHQGHCGENVPKRGISRKGPVKGIVERSKVQRGPDWRWANQDGGADKQGEVIAIVNFSPETDHDAAEVTWPNGYTNVYRLGYKGRLDLKCTRPAKGGYYFRDHLPILKLNTDAEKQPEKKVEKKAEVKAATTPLPSATQKPEIKPVSTNASPPPAPPPSNTTSRSEKPGSSATSSSRFKHGDRVKIEIDVDVFKMIEENRGGWKEEMTDCIGKIGSVVTSTGSDVTVDFMEAGQWTFSESVLNKVKDFQPGEIVKVKETIDHVRMLQEERGGWNDLMIKVLGRKGRVEEVDDDGDVMVTFGQESWTFNPECLLETEGPADNLQELDDVTTAPRLAETLGTRTRISDDEKLVELFGIIFAGDADRVERIIQRDPQLMLMDYEGEFAIHQAAKYGNIDVATKLLATGGRDSQIEVKDHDGNTPLLCAASGGHCDIVRYLVEAGCKKDAANNNEESAVHIAVESKHVALLKLLRDLAFDVNKKNALQQSPIFEAIGQGNPDVLAVILTWPGLDLASTDSIGFNPFTAACRNGNIQAVTGILEISPGELNRENTEGRRGLHVAVLNKRTEVVRYLLSKPGFGVNQATRDGQTSLHLACSIGHAESVTLLLEKGADIRKLNNKNKTCLHLCSESTAILTDQRTAILDTAKVLVEGGVDVEQKDTSGRLAISYVTPAFKDAFLGLIQKHAKKPKTPSVTEPPQSLPQNLGASLRQNDNAGPKSMDASQSGSAMATAPPNQGPDIDDAELCESCDEEPVSHRLIPCRHLLCDLCKPPEKARKKMCNFCGEPVTAVEKLD